jgi:hypothetical protein
MLKDTPLIEEKIEKERTGKVSSDLTELHRLPVRHGKEN